jgi:hyperosmotically inducible protein
MKYPIFLAGALALTLVACSQNTPSTEAPDNTGVNAQDRADTETPFDQSDKEADLSTTQRIRQSLVNDPNLSTNAKNIKIITLNGRVTLRGPVKNDEKSIILAKIQREAGVKSVDDQLETTK